MSGELTPSEGAQLDQAEATIRDGLAPLDSVAARNLTQRIKANVATAWLGLLEADTRKAWAALGYANFADYVMAEFDISQTHAYRLIDHAKVIEALTESDSPIGEIKESQARVLKPVLDQYGPAAAAKVIEETKSAGKVTADAIAKTAQSLGYAHVTQTTRTTEATKIEHDVDLETGEITSPGSPAVTGDAPSIADSVPAPDVEPEPGALDPVNAAIERYPALNIEKATAADILKVADALDKLTDHTQLDARIENGRRWLVAKTEGRLGGSTPLDPCQSGDEITEYCIEAATDIRGAGGADAFAAAWESADNLTRDNWRASLYSLESVLNDLRAVTQAKQLRSV